eukprot:6067090-Prymnesium_polylepis.1
MTRRGRGLPRSRGRLSACADRSPSYSRTSLVAKPDFFRLWGARHAARHVARPRACWLQTFGGSRHAFSRRSAAVAAAAVAAAAAAAEVAAVRSLCGFKEL